MNTYHALENTQTSYIFEINYEQFFFHKNKTNKSAADCALVAKKTKNKQKNKTKQQQQQQQTLTQHSSCDYLKTVF